MKDGDYMQDFISILGLYRNFFAGLFSIELPLGDGFGVPFGSIFAGFLMVIAMEKVLKAFYGSGNNDK